MERWIVFKCSHMQPPIHGSYIMVLTGNKSWSTMYYDYYFWEREKAAQRSTLVRVSCQEAPSMNDPGWQSLDIYSKHSKKHSLDIYSTLLGDNLFLGNMAWQSNLILYDELGIPASSGPAACAWSNWRWSSMLSVWWRKIKRLRDDDSTCTSQSLKWRCAQAFGNFSIAQLLDKDGKSIVFVGYALWSGQNSNQNSTPAPHVRTLGPW